MDYKIVFSDVDGTLLNQAHEVLPGTLAAIQALQKKDIPFVIISARSPSGIYPIQERYQFRCPIISCSGALILDEARRVLHAEGLSRSETGQVLTYIEEKQFDCVWNVFSMDTWITKEKHDPRVPPVHYWKLCQMA